MALVVSVPIPLRTQRARAAQEVRGTSDLRGPEWNVDPRDAKLFYGITENKKSANEHLTQTPKNSLWKPLRDYGKIVSNRVVTITYEGESLLWLLR